MTDAAQTTAGDQDLAAPYHRLRVAEVIRETADTQSFVLEVPEALAELFAYRAGQFLTFRVEVEGKRLVRCYSLASSPDTERKHKFTVKRVDGGRVSNQLNDQVRAGSQLEVMKPAGVFCLQERSTPLLLFGGGSGVTPLISIVKSALTTSDRRIKLLYANRDADSVIFKDELEELAGRYPERFELTHRLDDRDGFATADTIVAQVGDERGADFYICGPGPYMDVVEAGLAQLEIPEEQIFIERFTSPEEVAAAAHGIAAEPVAGGGGPRVTVSLDGETREIEMAPGETVLLAVRRVGMDAPFACEDGYCGCCMAKLLEGEIEMKKNTALEDSQLAQGWVLTCQGVPKTPICKIEYPD